MGSVQNTLRRLLEQILNYLPLPVRKPEPMGDLSVIGRRELAAEMVKQGHSKHLPRHVGRLLDLAQTIPDWLLVEPRP